MGGFHHGRVHRHMIGYEKPVVWDEKVSRALPPDARALLVAASKVPEEVFRVVAIDKAIKEVRSRYPKLFKEETK